MSIKKKQAKRKPGKVLKFPKRSAALTHGGGDELATVSFADAMKQTGKSMGFIYRCINDGRLPAFKVARSTVFRQSDIDKLMTPVPYTPTSERPYAKNIKPKAEKAAKGKGKAKKAPKARSKSPSKASRTSKPRKPKSSSSGRTTKRVSADKATKAAVAKALDGMAVEGSETTP
jgi:predicted DNA-binding transcriptional regulator AlpA